MGHFFPRAKTEDIVIQEVGAEVLVYDLVSDQAFLLNDASAKIWRACDGELDIEGVVTTVGELPRDVTLMGLSDLCDKGLVDRDQSADHFYGTISRRQAIVKYGAAMFAIPLIASLVAPPPLHAASACIPDNGTFTLHSTTTNDCFQPVNFNKCCSQSIKTTAFDGINTVTCTCGTVIIP